MPYELDGPGGAFDFSGPAWGAVFRLARMHGWEPEGTTLTRDSAFLMAGACDPQEQDRVLAEEQAGWNGNYVMSQMQLVSGRDAASMADALERALPDVPGHDAAVGKNLVPLDA